MHILENARAKGIFVDTINGHKDHCHCLVSLGPDRPVSKILQLLKGESSYWINRNKLCKQKFEWQDEYFAASISDFEIEYIRRYIRNQEDHHKARTFENEYNLLIEGSGFKNL